MNSLTDIGHYPELLAAEAFVNLLASCCLDVSENSRNTSSDRRRLFRARPGLDVRMMNPHEQAVLAAADRFRDLPDLLREAGERISKDFPKTNRRTRNSDFRALKSIRQTIKDALVVQLPESLGSV